MTAKKGIADFQKALKFFESSGLVVSVVTIPLVRPPTIRHGKLELGPITAPPLFLAATDFVDDPGLQHGNSSAYRYGLQHRGPTVKLLAPFGFSLCF